MFLLKTFKNFQSLHRRSFIASFSLLAEEGTVVDVKDEVVFFKNFKEKNLKFKSLLKLPDDKNHIFLLALNENFSCGPLVKKLKGNVLEGLLNKKLEILSQDTDLLVTFSKEMLGNVVDYRGSVIETDDPEEKSPKTQSLDSDIPKGEYSIQQIFNQHKNIERRVGTNGQIWTGNLALDYSNPIAKGNFVIFKGEHSTGKSQLAANIVRNFLTLEQSLIYNRHFTKTKAVYVSLSHQNARKAKKLLEFSSTPQNYVVFAPAPNASQLEKFLLPFSALRFARDLQKNKNDVLLIFDDALEHYYKENHLFNAMNQPFSPLNIINEINSVTGCFSDGSLTSLIIMDTGETQPVFFKGVEAFRTNAESLADLIVDFDLKDEIYRHVKPKLDFEINRNVNPWQARVINLLKDNLRAVMERLREEKVALEGKKELKIHIDPWEAYFFLDSTYFMRMLIGKRFYSPIESLVVVRFTLKAIEEGCLELVMDHLGLADVVSLFKDEPEILIEKLLAFCKFTLFYITLI